MLKKSLFQLSQSELARFSEGYTVPLLSIMHHGSDSGVAAPLDWSKFRPNAFTGADWMRRIEGLVHYDEAIPSLAQCDFKDKSVLILGSSVPWLELFVFFRGARNILTVEYRNVDWSPNFGTCFWESKTWEEFRDTQPNRLYDIFISYSSIEHSGLGRYGDPIDPDGDLKSLAVSMRWLNQDADLLLAVPVGLDCIKFNRHRVYGPKRLARLKAILKGRAPRVIVPSEEFSNIGHSIEAFSLEYAFSQPIGYDAQLLLKFSHE